jgi:hypothetical protein
LGRRRDSEIAAMFGISSKTIRRIRREHGIERYKTPCGTATRYSAGCRCRACKDAHTTRNKQYWKEHPEAYNRHLDRKAGRVPAVESGRGPR